MAAEYLTLAEAGNLRQAQLFPELIPTVINMSPILSGGQNELGGVSVAALPFKIVNDRVMTIVRQTAKPAVNWYDPGEKVTGETKTTTQTSFTIRGLKFRVVIPREIREGYASLIDQAAMELKAQLESMTDEFMKAFYYGDNATNSKEPSGLHKLVSTATPDMHETMAANATGAALTLTKLDILLLQDMKVRPDLIVCSRNLGLQFAAAARSTATGIAGNFSSQPLAEWGMPVLRYAGIPLFVDDYLTQTELCDSAGDYSAETTGATSTIFGIKFGPKYLHGISFSQAGPRVEYLTGPTQDYDGDIIWAYWDAAIVLESPFSVGNITNITDVAIAA